MSPGPERERKVTPTHIVKTELPTVGPDADVPKYRLRTDPSTYTDSLTDEANFPEGNSPAVYELTAEAGAEDVSAIVLEAAANGDSVLAIGAQTSLTGAAVPRGDILIDFSLQTNIEPVKTIDGRHFVEVQPGTTFAQLEKELAPKGLFIASAPTWSEATVGGAISTNAAGARSDKYGAMRTIVQGLEVVLANGHVLKMERGDYISHPGDEESPGGYFIIENDETGESYRLPMPDITMPDVPKIAAGYYSQPHMDLIDLFVGSENTLGVITKATLEAYEEPPTYMALIPCDSDEQALDLIDALASSESPIDPRRVAAAEIVGAAAVRLVRSQTDILPEGTAFVLAQVEGDEDTAIGPLLETCEAVGINDDGIQATDSRSEKQTLIAMRESAPLAVAHQIAINKAADAEATGKDSEVTKAGSDPSVNPEHMRRMIEIYLEEAAGRLDIFFWGHGKGGNLHFNTTPRDAEETRLAKEIIFNATARVIEELNGTGNAEHGTGKNLGKQALVKVLYGEDGIASMKLTKAALDPHNTLAPGNIFA